jgi:hypothetical protein
MADIVIGRHYLVRTVQGNEGIGTMYKVFMRVGNGELIHIESYDTFEQAVKLMEGFNGTWPGEYVVRDAEGNDLSHTEKAVILKRT